MNAALRPGDLVEVRTPTEILETLDEDGASRHLPFMPEMVEFCGKRFRVSRRVVKTCSSGSRSSVRTFPQNDIVLLDGLRCSGADHDGCQKACAIFWRETWLRAVDDGSSPFGIGAEDVARLRARLKTKASPVIYFCQASELLKATAPLSRKGRIATCVADIRSGNCSVFEMARRIAIWVFWRTRRRFFGEYAHGPHIKTTPSEALGLCGGDWVDVKSMDDINRTLNPQGYNRGLYFSPDMRLLSGRRQRVERKLEKIIVDGSGEMRRLQNTVYLENSPCGCAHVAFGGCSRGEFSYWREIWLRRPTP